jgi:hypothetical protein
VATNPSELRARRAALQNAVADTVGDGVTDRSVQQRTAVEPSVEPPTGAPPVPDAGAVVATDGTSAQTRVIDVDRSAGAPARGRRVEARKVRRLIRHVDPWSVAKASILFFLSFWFIVMIAAVIVWTVARGSGTVEKIETFIESNITQEDFRLDGDFLFRQFGLVSLVIALGGALATTIASVIFNLISDIIGGVWVTVIEEESVRA